MSEPLHNPQDWAALQHGGIRRILMQELPLASWNNRYTGEYDGMQLLDHVTNLIMEEVRVYTNKLADKIHKEHHDDAE